MGGTTIGTKALRAFERRAATQHREAKARRDGSSGPASACRLIDPATGAVLGEYQPHRFEPPAARLCLTDFRRRWKDAERQRRHRARYAMERKAMTVDPVRDALVGALIASERLSETDALDDAKVAAASTEVLDVWAKRWWD